MRRPGLGTSKVGCAAGYGRVCGKDKPQELAFLGSGYGAFALVHLQSQPLLQEGFHRVHDALSRTFATHVDVTIVRVADEAMPALFQVPVPLVQENVGQQARPDNAASFQSSCAAILPLASFRFRVATDTLAFG